MYPINYGIDNMAYDSSDDSDMGIDNPAYDSTDTMDSESDREFYNPAYVSSKVNVGYEKIGKDVGVDNPSFVYESSDDD